MITKLQPPDGLKVLQPLNRTILINISDVCTLLIDGEMGRPRRPTKVPRGKLFKLSGIQEAGQKFLKWWHNLNAKAKLVPWASIP
jgi:hypothetical protein